MPRAALAAPSAVTFLFFAVAAVGWALVTIRWTFSPRRAKSVVVMSAVVLGAAVASLALDVRAIGLASAAPRSKLAIHVIPHGDWWQLDYERDGVAFTTANELHVPAQTAVMLTYAPRPAPSIADGVCVPLAVDRYALVARRSTTCRLGRRSVRVIADPPAAFDAWLRNEARPACAASPLFTDAGCAYCHVIRGVAVSPSKIAPELTHFAARATIAAIDLPNRHGNLAGWIVNSAAIKRSSQMPENRLDPAVLHALVAYLQSLR